MISTLKERLPQWNNDSDSNVAFAFHGDETVLAICTPMMKRPHPHMPEFRTCLCLNLNLSVQSFVPTLIIGYVAHTKRDSPGGSMLHQRTFWLNSKED